MTIAVNLDIKILPKLVARPLFVNSYLKETKMAGLIGSALVGGGGYNDIEIRTIWSRGRVIPNFDPGTWRWDKFGLVMHFGQYGKTTEHGWEVNHVKPQSWGGSGGLHNLQPLHWKSNRSKGDRFNG